jgi:amino acid transporter
MAMAAPAGSSGFFGLMKRVLVGRSMTSGRMEHTLLPKSLAIPVLSADCLSSVAYTVEATLLVLIGASLAARHLLMPITIAVAILMSVVVTSYMQTVRAYRTSGGAYVVAKENIGVTPGLVAAGSLMVGYVLTVAVSVVAGVIAITSAIPALLPYKVTLSIVFVVFITVANLRGLRESGILFAVPTYGFIVAIFAMVGVGLWKCAGGCPHAAIPSPISAGEEVELSLLVILEAFAVGSSALTGVEAISNAVTVFRRPQGKNAAHTLFILGSIAVTLILALAFLSSRMAVTPSHSASVVSIVAKTTFPSESGGASPMFLIVQIFTFAILVLAANTSFQGFPRLAALMARDGYLPRQFENVGDRLVFSNGMIVLAVLSCVLIWAFDANVEKLIPLYAVGVFTAFTLSQSGMVVHWRRVARRGGPDAKGWRRSLIVNGAGAFITGMVVLIITITRFKEGVWVVIAAMPFLVLGFRALRRHYDDVSRQLHEGSVEIAEAPRERRFPSIMVGGKRVPLTARRSVEAVRSLEVRRSTVVIVVDELDEATAQAIGYVRSFAGQDFHAVHRPNGHDVEELSGRWAELSRSDRPLQILPRSRGSDAVLDYVRGLDRPEGTFVNVVIPELFPEPSLVSAVRRRAVFSLKVRLLAERQVVITDVPVVASRGAKPPASLRALIPRSNDAIVFVSSANDAAVQAINYALTLNAHETRAVYVALDAVGPVRMQEAWAERRINVQLDIVEAPFRDFGPPMLEEVRAVTARPGALATVVVPEFVVGSWWRQALHNQRALFIKRLMLFERDVVLSSVPFQIR